MERPGSDIPNPYEVIQPREYELGQGRPPVYMPTTPVRRPGGSPGLYDVVELILDRGIVIDAFVRVSLVGIELLTIDARVVIAGVDTYLRFAEAANRLDLRGSSDAMGLPQLFGADSKAKMGRTAADALEGGRESLSHAGSAVSRGARKVKEAITGGGDDDEEQEEGGRKRGKDWR
jgi:hypothetical protein